MLECISVENMRESDRKTIERFTPSLVLMHRAAMGVYRSTAWHGRVAILAGSGNNGGDGYALACILRESGIDCAVYALGQRLSPDGAHYAEEAAASGVPIYPFQPGQGTLNGFDFVVDCLLGTGFQGAVRESYAAAIREINGCGATVISVDINSGMNGDTGEGDVVVDSDLTVTVAFVKNGLLTAQAAKHIKRLVCADIGIVLDREENKICDEEEWRALGYSGDRVTREGTVYFRRPPWLEWNTVDVRSV